MTICKLPALQNASTSGAVGTGGGTGVGGSATGQDVTIISKGASTPADINLRPFLEPNPKRPTCLVRAGVFLSSSYVSPENRQQPTAYPVPSVVLGAINFTVYQLAPASISVCSPLQGLRDRNGAVFK